jgi:protein disulfide-isomerase A6
MSFTLICLSLLIGVVSGFYEKNENVVALTAANFEVNVYSTEHPWLVEFYAPWCGHCQRLVPEFEKASENLKGIFKFGAVNCDEDKNKEICGRFGIQGFPTLKIFPFSTNQNKRGFSKEPKDYQGARTGKAIVDACLTEVPNNVIKVISGASSGKNKNIEDFLAASPTVPKALLFTTKTTTTPLLKALALDFLNRLTIGEVRDTEKEIVARYEHLIHGKYPALVILPVSAEPILYEGNLKHDELFASLSKYALPGKNPQQEAPKGGNQQKQPEKEIFDPEVKHITTQKQFKEECLDKPMGMCLLSFMVLEPDFEESVKEHKAQLEVLKAVKKTIHDKTLGFRVFWLDALTERKLMDKFMLSDQVPSLLIISPSKKIYRPFTGAFEEKSIIDFLNETSKGKGRHFKFDFEPILSIEA